MIKANNKDIKTWIVVPSHSDFPIQNIPFGIAKRNNEVFVATRIGDTVVNLYQLARLGYFSVEKEVFASCRLNDFMLLGKQATRTVRNEISDIFNIENEAAKNNVELQKALNKAGEVEMLQPIFLVRDNEVMRVRDDSREMGLYANFTNLNVETDEATFYMAQRPSAGPLRIPLAVAPQALRTDYIGLQAIEFPGINLFWFGALSMMLGMLINLVI